MSTRPESRQALYDQIRETSRDEVILNEMIRLGFWKKDKDHKVPEDLIRRKGEVSKKIRKLIKKQTIYMDREQALAEIHRIRKEEAKKRKLELKEERERKERERKEQWKKKQATQILFLGHGYSHELENFAAKPELLGKYALQSFDSHIQLAQAMGIGLRELKFLCFTREVSSISHYRRFTIPKKSGGERLISAPQERLKSKQYWIYENILKKLPIHPAANGFTEDRSILSNATPHLQSQLLINLDLKDFFPSVTYLRVLGMFKGMGYSPAIATIFALLTTELEVEEVELDGKTWFVANGDRRLPQGAPTSPAITNWICRRLDARLQGVADKLGFRYTRYADDMSFSLPAGAEDQSQKLLWHVKKIISEEGFTIHPDKLRIMRKGRHQEVTGIVVNEKASVSRKKVKTFRALLHHLKTKGLEGATWEGSSDRLLARALGYARFLVMVDTPRFIGMLKEMEEFAESQGFKQEVRHLPKAKSEKARACIDLTQEEILQQIEKEVPKSAKKKKEQVQADSKDKPVEAEHSEGLFTKLIKRFFGR